MVGGLRTRPTGRDMVLGSRSPCRGHDVDELRIILVLAAAGLLRMSLESYHARKT